MNWLAPLTCLHSHDPRASWCRRNPNDALDIDPGWTPESALDGLEVLAVLGHLATAEHEDDTRILFAGSRQDLDELGGSYVAGDTEWLVIYARGGDVWQPATVRALARPGRQEDDPQHFEEL